jgi:hypothetical protein
MWQDFTNLYSLSKTLRFELKPTEKTNQLLHENGIIQTDKARHESFGHAKKVLDEIHRFFIADSLENLGLDNVLLQSFATISLSPDLKNDKAKQTELEKARKNLHKSFETQFAATQSSWEDRYGCDKFITSPEAQLSLIGAFKSELSDKLDTSEEDLATIQAQFEGFASYFQGYKQNRENMYTTNAHATEIAHRTVDQNLLKFYKNLQKYEKFYVGNEVLPAEAAECFKIENYHNFITQDEITGYNDAIASFRSVINQARQGFDKQQKKSLPMFEPLFKQILGDGTKKVLFEKLENDEEYRALPEKLQQDLPGWLSDISAHAETHLRATSDPSHIWLNTKAINGLIYKNLTNAELVKSKLPASKKSKDEEINKQNNFVSLETFLGTIDEAQAENEQPILKNGSSEPASKVVWQMFCNDVDEKITEVRENTDAFTNLQNFTNTAQKETLKKCMDSFNDLYRMYSYFELRYKNEPVTSLEIDPDFYGLFEDPDDEDSLFDTDKDKRFPHYYDLIRNYLTKKPYSLDKWKLNFDCSQLLSGWDVNKEPEKHGAILKNHGNYYLAVLLNSSNKVFDRAKNPKLFQASEDSSWQKMEYKLLPGPNKMLPKCLLPKSDRKKYGATDEILEIYEAGAFKKGDAFELAKLHKMIDFYKQAIARYPGWAMYDFGFRDTNEYQSIDEFYHEVESRGYKLDFVPIDTARFQEIADEGKIYLFKIQNKDLSNPNAKTPNLHTQYFCAFFQQGSKIKLNGEAEIFFRPKSIEAETAAGRKTPQGSSVAENRRFTRDNIALHLPLTLNYQTKSLVNGPYNQHVMERIKTNRVDAVIGIDRGEKHLAYVAVVDKNGKLLEEPISLNTIIAKLPNGRTKATPYFDLLDGREKERLENRQNWDAVRQIKDLKSGYIGHCVKQIVDLMIKHNAVVALENLNVGFKQGRSAIEKSVYNQLEQALLHKLQYIVDKSKQPHELFGSENGVQLAPPDVTPGSTSNHMGFVFFVDPSYTSAVDPVTGYRQHFRLDERINTRTFSNFIKNGFDDIVCVDGNLLFTFSWRKLAAARNKIKKDNRSTDKEKDISDKTWTITARVERLVYDKKANENHGATVKRYPQQELLALLQENGIDLNKNIKEQLATLKPNSKFVGSFIYLFNTINKLRNSDTANNVDAIISPVYQKGFDSTKDTLDGYAWNGDANGAYNIARKAAILLDKLYAADAPKDFKATVTRKEYDDYLTK